MPARIKLAVCTALVAALLPPAASAEPLTVTVLKSPNRSAAGRSKGQVDRIVVHITEGGFDGSVRWLRDRRSRASAHFVVSQKGEIVQLVSTSYAAWHAGERGMNARSVGIEHEGWAERADSLTRVQYEQSARLAAHVANRFGIPIDRQHIVGHNEVPHPTDPATLGGIDAHECPGPYWDWDLYLGLVRRYAESGEQAIETAGDADPRPAAPAPATIPAERVEPAPTIFERIAELAGLIRIGS